MSRARRWTPIECGIRYFTCISLTLSLFQIFMHNMTGGDIIIGRRRRENANANTSWPTSPGMFVVEQQRQQRSRPTKSKTTAPPLRPRPRGTRGAVWWDAARRQQRYFAIEHQWYDRTFTPRPRIQPAAADAFANLHNSPCLHFPYTVC